jgi:hypothetical protein
MFLLKQGEDLRLDQRVEDAFGIMNRTWQRDSETAAVGLAVPQLVVTPLSRSGGLMEWLQGGETLEQRVSDELTAAHPGLLRGKPSVMAAQLGISELDGVLPGGVHSPKNYWELFLRKDEDMAQAYANACAAVPSTSLQGMVARMAPSPPAYHAMRKQLAATLAATNTACYLLGVGDRHLQNIMLVPSRGCVVPIDFGYSFSIGTDTLPIVELYGIRLTPCLRAMLAPLHHGRALTLPMARALGAQSRNQQELLLSLQAFVQDPIIDWAYNAEKATAMKAAVMASGDASVSAQGTVGEDTTLEVGPSGTVPISAGPAASGSRRGTSRGATSSASKKRGRNEGVEAASEGLSGGLHAQWYPLRKLLRVRQKLAHTNPAAVLGAEVRDNAIAAQHERSLKALVAVLDGQVGSHVRAGAACNIGPQRLCAGSLEQAEALVEIATDATLLMRQWRGLFLHV